MMGKRSSKPLATVIMIFLNAGQFIQEAIESVFAQTYDRWELLLVDDGSTDGSTEIALRYAEQWPERVRYLEHDGHQNHGMSASRNLGIRAARGEYISFLDADDVIVSNTLEEQVAILESHPEAAMVYGPIQWWYGWTGNPGDRQRDFVEELGVQPDTVLKPPTLLALFLQDKGAVPSGVLVRRDAALRVGGFEDTFRGEYEDQVFCAKICLKEAVFAAGRCWYRYRQHPNSCVSLGQGTGRTDSARLFFLNWIEGFLVSEGVKDAEVWRALRSEIWRYRHPILFSAFRGGRQLKMKVEGMLLPIARRILPAPIRSWLWARSQGQMYCPPVGWVRFGNLRRTEPLSRAFGYDRGLPIDRYYIERFLATHASDVRGRVLEIADDDYTRRYGGDHVTRSDVLHVVEGNPKATIIGDLTRADHIPSDTFDCVILTQTLQFIYDVPAALKTLHRILKPGGVVLATFPGISPISGYDMERWGCYWSFTTLSARRLFKEAFPDGDVQVETFGNVLSSVAFLYGMASHELNQDELDYSHPEYELLSAVRAVKPETAHRGKKEPSDGYETVV